MPSHKTAAFASKRPKLCLVIPCFDEEQVFPQTAPRFVGKIVELISCERVGESSRVIFIDDGSQDSTWELIEELSSRDEHVEGMKLSRNFGHQNALMAGLMQARKSFDVAITLDCDGQDDIDAVDAMLEHFTKGCEVVYGVRSNRDGDPLFKRLTAEAYYRILNAMGVESVFNHADYRLMSSRALDALSEFEESNLFLRGLVPSLGFKSDVVEYVRSERIAGDSHYSLRKMMALALDGITSFSTLPIRFISAMGICMSFVSLIGIVWVIASVATGGAVAGWASLATVLLFIGGIQLTALGVIGEYIGKMYLETKRRPRYILEKCTLDDDLGRLVGDRPMRE